ncbi:MAG TPA: hypothetical protein VI756_23870 [Blastocatellia bacterium]
MENVSLARLALIPLALVEVGYTYFYMTHLYVLPRHSIGWFLGWALWMVIVIGSTFAQIFIYKSITGKNRVDDDPVLALVIVFAHLASVGIGFYMLWTRRSGS